MLDILIAAAFGAFQAPECVVAFERHEEARLVLRLRPACTLGHGSTQGAVRTLLAQEGDARELSVSFGRIERWLVAGVSVEKVLVKSAAELSLPAGAPVPPHSKLPFDAIVWVTLRRP